MVMKRAISGQTRGLPLGGVCLGEDLFDRDVVAYATCHLLQIGVDRQAFFARSPVGRGDFACLFDMQIGLDLSEEFIEISTYRWGEHLLGYDHAFRVDQKSAPDRDTVTFVVDTKCFGYFVGIVRTHFELEILHQGFRLYKSLVRKFGIT